MRLVTNCVDTYIFKTIMCFVSDAEHTLHGVDLASPAYYEANHVERNLRGEGIQRKQSSLCIRNPIDSAANFSGVRTNLGKPLNQFTLPHKCWKTVEQILAPPHKLNQFTTILQNTRVGLLLMLDPVTYIAQSTLFWKASHRIRISHVKYPQKRCSATWKTGDGETSDRQLSKYSKWQPIPPTHALFEPH